MENLLFYDIEVFKYDSLVVFKDIDNNIVGEPIWFTQQTQSGSQIIDIVTDKTLVGYNNHYYDDVILTIMIRSEEIKEQTLQEVIKANNDALISGDGSSWGRLVKDTLKKYGITTLDTMQQIDVSHPSLKKIEGNMGRSILESSVPFDIDRPLNYEEKEETLKYCSYDVENTIEVYKKRIKSYFDTKSELLNMLGDESLNRLNTTTLSAKILMDGKKNDRWHTNHVSGLPNFRNVKDLPDDVWEMWESIDSKGKRVGRASYKTKSFYDCEITFGFGGLHGVALNRKRFDNVMLLDVASMYPTIVTNLKVLGDDATVIYDQMRQERVRIKHADPKRATALKLILNSVYGNLKSEYSDLYNPVGAVCVCAYGQMSLFELCGMLHEAGYTVMNINTDGVAFVDENNVGDVWKDIQKQWEAKWNMSLDLDTFDLWIQKDVNNYIAKSGDHIKVKGGECNKYNEEKLFSNNDARIIQIALVEALLNDKEPWRTVKDNVENPVLYQYVLKAGNTYDGTFDADGNQYNNVNRIFAASPMCKQTTKLYKRRPDGGMVNFPDMPERMFVWNDEVSKIPDFSEVVDIGHYTSIVNKKLEGWL